MSWIVEIENKPKFRILVDFHPLNDMLSFHGQLKTGKGWIDYSVEEHPTDIDLIKIKEILFDVHDKLNNRVEKYDELAKGFEFIKEIEIKED